MKPVLTLVLALALSAPADAEDVFRVTGRSLTVVHVDAGRARGIKIGDHLRVVSGSATVGELLVVFIDERSSSCRVESVTRPIQKGDRVVRVERTAAAAPPAPGRPASPTVTVAARAATPPKPPPPESDPAPSPRDAQPVPTATPAETPARAAPPPTPAGPVASASPAASARGEAGGRRFRVSYRSAASVYLDGGVADGLRVGDRLRVVDGSSTVAEVEVAYTAERSASCRIVSESRPVRAGDEAIASSLVRPPRPASEPARADPAPVVATVAAEPVAPPARNVSSPWARVRGAASFGYYRSWDATDSALDYQQRTARVDLVLDRISGQPLSFTLRARSRQDVRARTLSTRTPQSERTDRLYEAALRYEPPSDRVAFEAGRIGIYRFVGVGYLDGALVRYRPAGGVQIGAFGGRVAEIEGLGFGGTGSKYGAFVRLAPAGRYARGGYDATLAYVRENAEGDVSREYLSLESFLGGGTRLMLSERAELDLNRGWRQDLTGKAVQLSNVSLSGTLRLASSSWATVSYDGRRNYRYYQNRVVPEEVFDDLLHQGLRAGLSVARPGGFGASASFGMSLKEKDPRHPELDVANAYSVNAGLRHANAFGSGLSLGVDGSGFTNGYADGGLVSARLGWRAAAGHTLDLSGGYSLYRVSATEEDRKTQWLRLVGRAELPHRLYLLGDFEYDAGDDLEGPRAFLEIGVFF